MEQRGESRASRTLRAMYPAHPQAGDEGDTTRAVTQVSRPHPAERSLSRALPERDEMQRSLIIRPQPQRTLARIPTAPQAHRSPASRWYRPAAFLGVLVVVVGVVGFQLLQAAHQPVVATSNFPAPSGRGPWDTSSGSVVIIDRVAPVTASTTSIPAALQPCKDATMFLPTITQWSVPPGCYGNIYQPNQKNYPYAPGFGWCNWWVRVTHPNHPDITENLSYTRGTNPMAGAPIFFDGNEQGASSEGHWALAVAVAPDHYWVLISEMNFAWRGAGWGKLDYRYVHVSPHVHFVYIYS